MSNPFFDHPILNSPYECPLRHWELDPSGQPTQQIIERRRRAEFITPIPKPKKRKAPVQQEEIVFDEGKGLSTKQQQYDPTSIINEVRQNVDSWRALPSPSQWQVTPETARLLQHWRHHKFSGIRPFFCQVEAVETAIWLTEVAPQSKSGKRLLDHLANANKDANPELMRFALKLATGAGKTTVMANRLCDASGTLRYKRVFDDTPVSPLTNIWADTGSGSQTEERSYVVQTVARAIERCLLMATDPGDLVLDPTCGSGTTAYVAEQWGRRWITIDTSRVALALSRARIMGARYPFYLLADSREGQLKEAEVTRTAPSSQPVRGNIRHGFVYERVPHITLKSIANNAEIDVIWDKYQALLEPLRQQLNEACGTHWEEWEIPRELTAENAENTKKDTDSKSSSLRSLRSLRLKEWWASRIARQQEIDKSIAAKAEFEHLYDKPYDDKKKVRVAGPFTVESLSPHRVLGVDEDDELIDPLKEDSAEYGARQSFPQMILENLKTAGVQQAHKEDRITFTALTPWPGDLVCAEGRYESSDLSTLNTQPSTSTKRAAIFIGPEFGTVQRADLVAAAREAGDAGFDVLIACAFNYEAHATEFSKLGRIPVLKARMNADLHMAEDLKTTNKANLFVIFGEPDITLLPEPDGKLRVKVNGVDVFDPSTGEVRSDSADGIACWFVDTDYNEESFFVRHAYFLGANDPYSALKTTLKAEINAEAWATLNSDTSRPFEKPKSGRIAVKVINHLGDEVMKVFKVT
jgi:adenine-specific DNA-methyltransferase